jgi:hypothetical protein
MVPLGTPVDLMRDGIDGDGVDRRAVIARMIPDAWAQRLLDAIDGSPVAPVLALAVRHWRSWAPGRRRVVLGAVVAATVIAGALAIVPSAPPDAANAVQAPSTASPSMTSSATAAPQGVLRGSASALAGDDPIEAAMALVVEREHCLRTLSQLCLDGVEQPDSGALRDDREAIRVAKQGGELPDPLVADTSRLAPELVERLGDSVLVRLTVGASASPTTPSATATPTPQPEPASLLVVKDEAGWRIRDVIAASAGSS